MEKQGYYLTSFQRELLNRSLQYDLRPEYSRRIEIMLLADRGQSQNKICKTLKCSQETARYWIKMAQTGQAHKWKDRPRGRPKIVNEKYLKRLKELVSSSPSKYGYSFKYWTAHYLNKHLTEELGIKCSDCHINRLLKQMGLSTKIEPNTDKIKLTKDKIGNSRLFIKDLTSTCVPEFSKFWQLNLID